jgi:DNA polymerase-3 subunit delta
MALHEDDTGQGATLEGVLAEISKGRTSPCYLLFGEEEFRLRDALARITEALIPDAMDRQLNLFVADGERQELSSLCESLTTPPLLPGRKVIVVRDTLLFQAKNVLAPLISRIREKLDTEPDRAAGYFMQFLALTGMQLEDLRDGGWRRLDSDTWRRIVPDDDGEDRESWLPRAVELCTSLDLAPVHEASEETDRLEQVLCGGMPAGNHLILTARTADKRKKLFKTLSSVGTVLSFVKITGEGKQRDRARLEALQEMAAGLLTRSGKRLSAGAWNALGRKTGLELRESLGALEKLVTYTGERKQIEAEDVEAVIGRTREEGVFDLTRAISDRNLTAALGSLRELLNQGDQPLMIFSMIVREIRILLQAKLLLGSGRLGAFGPDMDYGRFQKTLYPALKQGGAGREGQVDLLSQHPFVVYRALKNAERFTRGELTGSLVMLADIDLALKSTGSDPRLLLERFLVAACRLPARLSP